MWHNTILIDRKSPITSVVRRAFIRRIYVCSFLRSKASPLPDLKPSNRQWRRIWVNRARCPSFRINAGRTNLSYSALQRVALSRRLNFVSPSGPLSLISGAASRRADGSNKFAELPVPSCFPLQRRWGSPRICVKLGFNGKGTADNSDDLSPTIDENISVSIAI